MCWVWDAWEHLEFRKEFFTGRTFWELLAIKAKEVDGVTQSVYIEGKEAEIRHYETTGYRSYEEDWGIAFKVGKRTCKIQHNI